MLNISSQEFFVRLPSMISGSLSVFMFYRIVHTMFGKQISAISTAVFAISPFHIWYSQEERPYAILLFLTLLSLFLLQKLTKNLYNPWLHIAFMISIVSSFYCNILSIASIGFVGLYIIISPLRHYWNIWLLQACGIALLIMPGLYRMMVISPTFSANAEQNFKPIAFLAYTIWAFSTGYSLGPTLEALHMPHRLGVVISYLPMILPIVFLFSGLFFWGTLQLLRTNRLIFLFYVLWFTIPLTLSLLGSAVTPHDFNTRYVIIAFLPFILFLSYGLLQITKPAIRILAVALIVSITALSSWNYFFSNVIIMKMFGKPENILHYMRDKTISLLLAALIQHIR